MSSAFSKTLSGVSQVISGAPDTPSGISAVPSEASQRPSEVLKILDPDASIVLLSLRILIGIVSVIGNGILLLIFFKFKTFRNQFSNWLISLLAFSDFVIGIGLLLKAIYSIFEKHVPGEGYNRLTCAIMASPQVLGVTCSQVMYISMAIDRLIAVKMKTQYGIFNLRSKIALIVGSWIGSSFFVFLGLFSTLPPGLSRQCSVGAVAGIPFLYIYVISSLLIALFIFSIYTCAIMVLRKLIQGGEGVPSNRRIKTQQRVFKSISFLLIFYFTFCIIPLIFSIIGLMMNLDEYTLGLISILIGLGADVNSCVGIFIYLSRHEEVKKHFKFLIKGNSNNNIQEKEPSPNLKIPKIITPKSTIIHINFLPWCSSSGF